MSVTADANGSRLMHFPEKKDKFEFDEEVAFLFDDMARRSIPMYEEAHRMHVSMLLKCLVPGTLIADIGSSTGMTYREIERQMGKTLMEAGVCAYAVDSSRPMNDRLKKRFPAVISYAKNVQDMPDLPRPVDIMFAYYVLQFVPPNERAKSLLWMVRNVQPGGYLVLGQKDDMLDRPFDSAFTEEYYKFRRGNGYTQQEIDAKTAALKNSMWPVPNAQLMAELFSLGFEAVETSRWLQFSTILAVKRG